MLTEIRSGGLQLRQGIEDARSIRDQTNGSVGRGRAIALLFARDREKVVVTTHVNFECDEETLQKTKEDNDEVLFIRADV